MGNKHRLPGHAVPFRYQLILKPDLEGFVFEGEEKIFLELKKAATEIVLHAKELEILDVEYFFGRNRHVSGKPVLDGKAETATLKFGRKVPKGKGRLELRFKGILNEKMRGFYRSRYLHEGKEKHLATTQFEATDARRAFPCFDEPAAKAIFDVTLIVPKKLAVVSNTIETKVAEHEAGYKLVEFAPTPKMSTYLLAFVVGDLEFIEGKTKRGVLVRVFTTPGKKLQAKFALECATRALDFYENYFDIKYPLPVLDMVAIPDFSSAAMENWGAIIYRETALLVDETNSSAANRQWVAIVVAHEIAHMWFGNLVTMHWWTHLWLNEGFASYMEYKCVDHLFPEWQMWEQYVSDRMSAALRLDALQNTHPVEVPVNHPAEISEIFDEVSYAKGSAVIRMLAEFLGEKTFRDGLRHYLKKHSYKNTRTEDLWASLEKVSGKPVKKIMDTWTKQPGYPLIKLIDKPAGFSLEQQRFYSSRLSGQKAPAGQLWQVPFSLGAKKALLASRSQKARKPRQPAKFNLGETSLLRVAYPIPWLKVFEGQVSRKKMPPIDRLGLVRDVFALAESGKMPTARVLEFVRAYKNENSLIVWEELADNLSRLRSLLYGQEGYAAFLKYCQSLFSGIYKQLGWNANKTDSHSRHMLRSLILGQMGASGDAGVLKVAMAKLHAKKPVPADLRSAVYSLAARAGGEKEYSFLLMNYKKAALHEEQERLGRALAQFQKPKFLKRTLEFSLSSHVRAQDAPFLIAAVFLNPAGRDLAWKFIMKNWPKLMKSYGEGLSLLSRLIKAAGVFATKEKAKEVKNFFQRHPVPGAQRTAQQVLERIESNADWLLREQKHLNHWLASNYEK